MIPLPLADHIARAVRAHQQLCNRVSGVSVMAWSDLIPCDFQLMSVPTFEAFERQYPVVVRSGAFVAQLWRGLPDDDRKRAAFYIRYFRAVWHSFGCDIPLPMETYLVCRPWQDVPAVIRAEMEAPWKAHAPSLAPELGEIANA